VLIRTFIAIKINPSEDVIHKISNLRRNLAFDKIKWTNEHQWHITFKFLGQTNTKDIENICTDLEQVTKLLQAFKINLTELNTFGSRYDPRLLWIKAEPDNILKNMQSKINRLDSLSDYEVSGLNFIPHLSIARIKKIRDLAYFQKLIDFNKETLVFDQFIDRIGFYESFLQPTGAKHALIEEFKLKK
jgi:2'-5' RNA ligase